MAALAEEIRAAVAETAPPTPKREAPRREPDSRIPLERAEAHLTPVIPENARFARAKRLLLRALRFLWRDQASFNALSLEAAIDLADGLERNSRLLEELARSIEKLQREQQAFRKELRRRLSLQDSRFALLEQSGPLSGTVSQAPAALGIPHGVYSLFEDRFRGSSEQITERHRFYLPFLKGLPGPVLEIGCGRGELLRLLRSEGIKASGIERNPLAIALCREAALEVEEGDALELLSRKEPGKLGAVVALQVLEHWSAEATFRFLRDCRRSIAPGGVMIAETINTDSLSAIKAFHLDPTHVRPLPPELLQFLAEAAGFADTRVEYRSPLPERERLAETSENDAKLNALLFAPQDYALIAQVPQTP